MAELLTKDEVLRQLDERCEEVASTVGKICDVANRVLEEVDCMMDICREAGATREEVVAILQKYL